MTTPSQTVGPFFALPGGLPWPDGPAVVAEGTPGGVLISGVVLDGEGNPVPDALIETWQVEPEGFGRSATDGQGRYWIRTVKPGALPTPTGETEAPHLDVTVLARGLLNRLITRIYFPDEAAANAVDPVLAEISDERQRRTLIAEPTGNELRFDIRLQGEGETVFFEV